MKNRILYILSIVAISAGLLFIFPGKKGLRFLSKNNIDRETEMEDDGPEKIAHHEHIMTIDPATFNVPLERLKSAEDALLLAQSGSRIESSNISWQERGPNNIGGRTRAILIDQSDGTGNTVWAGSVSGGLWKTTNFKNASPTWNQVGGISTNLAITTITQDPTDLQKIFVGTGEGFGNVDEVKGLGVYYTLNGGSSWTLLPSTTTGGANVNDFSYVQKLLVYSNGDVYAACISSVYCNAGGVLKSTNHGTSWTRVIGTYTGCGSCTCATDFEGFDIEMSASGDIYASTIDGVSNAGHIWKSTAGATVGNAGTWTNVTPTGTFQRIELACSATNNNKIYALTQGSSLGTGGTRLTTDGGATWSNINVGNWCDQGTTKTDFTRSQAWYDLILGVKPTDDATVYAGGVDILKTTNSGTNWSQLTQWASGCASLPYVHADIHAIQFFPGSPDEFIVGCDGGLFYTNDGGATFSSKNSTYNVTQYYAVAIHPSSGSNYMLAGAQDNGSHKFSSAGINAVTTATGGDGEFCFINSSNSNYQFTSNPGNSNTVSINRSTNGGTSFTQIFNLSVDRFINPADYDAANDIMYIGGTAKNVYRLSSMTGSPTSSNISNVTTNSSLSVSAIKIDPNTANRVWVAFSTSDAATSYQVPQLYILDNANTASPTKTAITLPAGIAASGDYISSIDIENGDANHVILTQSNYGVISVWETTDGGSNWASIEGDLPDMPVRWCKFTPSGLSPNSRENAVGGILIATELGVWSTNLISGASTHWVANNLGMGNVRSDMIVIRSSDNTIAVATHGRGVFTGTFSGALPVTLIDFTGNLYNRAIKLQWHTASEYNSKQFDLEKSFDGITYKLLKSVPAAGNSSTIKEYQFTDPEPLSEKNYYRLRSVDIDDKNTLSNVVLVKVPDIKQAIYVLGNPVNDHIDIRFSKVTVQKTNLRLLDMTGKAVLEETYPAGVMQISVKVKPVLQKAVYVLQIISGSDIFSKQIVH